MMTKAPPTERNEDELGRLRAEIAAMRGRLVAVESLLLGVYGPAALGGGSPKPPPAEPARTMRLVPRVVGFWGS